MLLLIHMAHVSKDTDPDPWYSEGHEALAQFALGRGRSGPLGRADLAAVERAMTPLMDAGVISVVRKSAGSRNGQYGRTAKYRLHLVFPQAVDNPGLQALTPHGKRGVTPHGNRGVPSPTVSVQTPHGNRGAKEQHRGVEENMGRSEGGSGRTKPDHPGRPQDLKTRLRLIAGEQA